MIRTMIIEMNKESDADVSRQTEQQLREVISGKPDSLEALYSLGLICQATNRLEEAASLFYRSIEINPSRADFYLSLGLVLKKLHRLKGAKACFHMAIDRKPDFPEAYHDLGITLYEMNCLDKAQACYCRALELMTDRKGVYDDSIVAEVYNNLGIVQAGRNLTEKAVASFRRAAELNHNNPYVFNNLGLTLYDLDRQDEAQACFRQAIALKPDYPEAYYNWGRVFKKMNCLRKAEKCFRQAIALKSDYLLAYNSLAVIFIVTNRLEAAENCLRQAIQHKPDNANAHRKLGRVLKMMHRLEEAEAAYLRAMKVSTPEQVEDSQFGLGILYLLQGQYTKGWGKYDLRRKLYQYPDEPNTRRWQGEELSRKKILLFCEQGLGDTIQFVRYAKKVAELAAETAVRVQEPLENLLAASFPFCKIYTGANVPPEGYDFACSLHSLPHVFHTSEDTIPRQVPYLWPNRQVANKWREALNQADGGQPYRVGIVWAGNPMHHNDHNRSIPFAVFSSLCDNASISWVSLQVGVRTQDLVKHTGKVIDFSRGLTDFMETAGLIANLDLVITVDSAVAHLAGSMGKKTWILLPFSPDWRWQLERKDSPWYSTVRLFRQTQIGDWQEVLERMKIMLGREINR